MTKAQSSMVKKRNKAAACPSDKGLAVQRNGCVGLADSGSLSHPGGAIVKGRKTKLLHKSAAVLPEQAASHPFRHIFLQPCADSAGSDTTAQLLLCVTVYNEPLTALTSTLKSVLTALQFARTNGADRQQGAQKACVALILDGPEKTHPDVLVFLRHNGLVAADCAEGLSVAATHFYYSRLLADVNTKPAEAVPLATTSWSQLADSVHFVVCVKDKNRGKLHSHALFFGTLCARLQPEFCFQIDAGTVIAPSAVNAMLTQFERMPQVGALASRVMSRAPQADDGFLSAWQYMDFATQAAVFWPAEIASGHLSVLPGQFCALRWAALSANMRRAPFQSDAKLRQACTHDLRLTPLDGYLRGMGAHTGMEKVMFLAEDRIIGNEIILAESKWQLEFCSSAHATTDACEQMGELLRQRRRWNNSSIACKLWLLGKWPTYLKRHDRSAVAKLRFSLAMLWQIALVFQQLVAPAFLACMVMLIAQAAWQVTLAQPQWGMPSAIAALALLAFVTTQAATRQADGRAWIGGMRDAAFCVLTVMVIVLLGTSVSALSLVLLFVPMALAVGLICLTFPHQRWLVLRRAPEYFMFVNPLMQVYLLIYSMLHIDDVSWGTKGLTADVNPDEGAPLPCGSARSVSGASVSNAGYQTRRALSMKHSRNAILTLWLVLNVGLLYVAAHSSAVYFSGLNPVLEVLCGLFVMTLTMTIGLSGVRALGKSPMSLLMRQVQKALFLGRTQRTKGLAESCD